MSDEYHGAERRRTPIAPEQIEEIADRAAKKALDKVYSEVGQAVLKKLAWLIGVVVIGFGMWLSAKGYVKVP